MNQSSQRSGPRSLAAASRAAFSSWLDACSPQLASEIAVGHETAGGLAFSLTRWPELEGSLTPTGLDIAAMRDGECWDLLLSLDVDPTEISSAWACLICEAEGKHERFATLEALWRDHLLDPLEAWIAKELASARGLKFYQQGGATWASLRKGA